VIKVDKKQKDKKSKAQKVDSGKIKKDHEDYGYDFVPNLNEWLNIDEQRQKTKELEDI